MPKPPEAPLCRRVPRWIAREASPAAARRFAPWILKTLSGMGHGRAEPISERTFAHLRAELRRADVTPALMEKVLREARRAEREDLSALGWAREIHKRAYGEELADKARRSARTCLKKQFGKDEDALQSPPTPEQALGFFLAWEELGGTARIAALRERERQREGALPQN